ncbi:MAG TPA: TonB-dependent receptor, partial [Hellea balneolensis]|nr:TonB-dependent receptor [Hellea balneolensis]
DADFTTADLIGVNDFVDTKTFTQEVRLTSTGDNTVDWLVGGYFFSEDIEQISGLDVGPAFRPYVDILSGGALNSIEPLFGFAPGSFFNPANDTVETFRQHDRAYSLFASVDFHLTDQLTLTGGLNYTKDDKTVSGKTVNPEPFSAIDLNNDPTAFGIPLPQVLFAQTFQAQTGLPATPANIAFIESIAPGTTAAIQAGVAAGISGLQSLQFLPQFLAFPNSVEDGLSSDSKTTYQIKAAYKLNDNINLYASYSTGFKATSWNLSRDSRPFPADQAALIAAGLTRPNQTYGTRYAGPENATNYEGGIKARFTNGALNVSIFQQSIDGFQSNTFVGTGFVLANAGKQTTKGVEFDATYVPIEPLKLTFSGVYLDAKYDSFVGAPGPDNTVQDLSGKKVAGVPKWGFSTSATYTHDFSGGTTGFVRADYQYESETSPVERITLSAPNPRSKTSIVNGSVGLNFENGFGLQIWGRNIFNHHGYISAFPGVVQAGTINAYPTQPATYGVLLRKDF